jgi:hypothetical protein
MVSFDIARTLCDLRAGFARHIASQRAKHVRRARQPTHAMRGPARRVANSAGMRRAVRADMADDTERMSWAIPLHVIMWTTITVGVIMAMAVFLMH